MNNCGTGAEKVCRFVSTRFFDCVQNDTVFYLRPKRKHIRSALIKGMCNFKDGTRAATAASKSNAELDGLYERLRHVVA